MTFKNYWQPIFFTLAAAFTLSVFFEPYPVSWLIKISPMIILIIVTLQKLSEGFPKLFLVGLIFSIVGDFILDYDRQGAFIYGLAAFFIAHVFYISSFGRWGFSGKNCWVAGFILILSLVALMLIFPNLGKLTIPVIAYMIVLLIMALSTIFSTKTNGWLILGGFSFLISDSIIGLDKFYTSIPYSHFLIMVSYYFAQYSLVRGLLATLRKKDKVL